MGILKDRANTSGAYMSAVNKGSLNMSTLTDTLNKHAKDGWRLHTIFEQKGNTIMVFEVVE